MEGLELWWCRRGPRFCVSGDGVGGGFGGRRAGREEGCGR